MPDFKEATMTGSNRLIPEGRWPYLAKVWTYLAKKIFFPHMKPKIPAENL